MEDFNDAHQMKMLSRVENKSKRSSNKHKNEKQLN